ncbi:MAG: hypothetical protein COB07_11695 [Sulfurovum sp.]|nr:MAG: hypothetical protein COB07_11695 [Sulfurovum sp.]
MHIIIPMSGKGQRFVDAGYTVPKPLIVVDGKPMLQHVIDLTPGDNKFTFICNHTHLTTTNMREQLLSMVPDGNIVEIPDHDLGPVYTVMQAIEEITDDEEIIINHCDFGTYWDYDDFLKHTHERDADGVVVGYKGFHPHMLGTTKYASMRDNKQWMLEIKEKSYFTDDPMSEYVSNGTYYFKNGGIVKKYFKELMDISLVVKGEYFVSLVYNMLVRDNLRVSIFEIQHMLQWGIPRDVEDYNSWSSYFRDIIDQPSDNLGFDQSDVNLITMNFDVCQFVEAGYTESKPFVDVNGRPMVLEAARYLPVGQKNIFVYTKDHVDTHRLKNEISKDFKKFQLLKVEDKITSMAAICYSGLVHVDEEASLQINATDNGVIFDQKKYLNLLNDEDVDGIVWIHKHYRHSEDHPERFNWVEIDQDILENISIKKPISDDPYKDHIAVGTFYFRKVSYFKDAYKNLLETKKLNNADLTVEDVVNKMIAMGFKLKIFEVHDYATWNSPDELKIYQYWQSFFHKVDWHPYTLDHDVTVRKEAVQIMDHKYRDFKQTYR